MDIKLVKEGHKLIWTALQKDRPLWISQFRAIADSPEMVVSFVKHAEDLGVEVKGGMSYAEVKAMQ